MESQPSTPTPVSPPQPSTPVSPSTPSTPVSPPQPSTPVSPSTPVTPPFEYNPYGLKPPHSQFFRFISLYKYCCITSGSGSSFKAVQCLLQPADVEHHIELVENDFSVEGGPLRSMDDPVNHDFLEAITDMEFPKELEGADKEADETPKVHLFRVFRERKQVGVLESLGYPFGPTSDYVPTNPQL